MKKKKETPMEKLTQGYEKFIKGKELNTTGGNKFQRVIKKAAETKKQRGSK